MDRYFADVRDVFMNDAENNSLYTLLSYSMYQPTAETIKERITLYHSSDIHVYACVENDTYIGLIIYRLCDQTATILDIAVHEHARGRGVGSFLIDGLLSNSRLSEVLAETDDDAVGFYQKYGFRVTDIKTKFDCKRYMCRYVPLEVKTITRDNWQRVVSKSFCYAEKTYGDCHCMTAMLTIDEVVAPLKKVMFGKELVLADKGYCWLQIAPEGEAWWLTVMIDSDGNIVQYYFDITDRNILDGEHSRFYDLYLDVVVLPDGNAEILDADELDTALKDGIITKAQYQKATDTANRLFPEVSSRLDDLEDFVLNVYNDLTRK